MIEIFNYKESFLNPLLKLIVPLIFLLGTYYFYQARNQYEGELGKVVNRLFWAGLMGFLANLFRFSADYITVSFKWGESLFFLLFALVNIYAAWPLVTFMRRMSSSKKE
jgi:hypothetical protein